LRGTQAAVATSDGRVHLLDLVNANDPRERSVLVPEDQVWSQPPFVAWREQVLWAAGRRLRAWDMTIPERPVLMTDLALEGVASDLSIDGAHAFVAQGSDGLWVFDIADPRRPAIREHLAATSGWSVRAVHAHGNLLWLVEGNGAAGVLRSQQLRPDGSLQGQGARSTAVADDLSVTGPLVAMVGIAGRGPTSRTRFLAIDAADVRFPRPAGEVDLPGMSGGRLAVMEGRPGRVLVAVRADGLRVLDLRVPAFPDEAAHVESPGGARDVMGDGDVAWLADGDGGLIAIHVGDGSWAGRAWLPWAGRP
jgi:hypothetical protein